MERFREKRSFTLIELAAVISILTILLTMIYPAINGVMERTHRAKAANNLRTIVLAHASFINDFGRAITFSDLNNVSENSHTANSFAAILAKYGYIQDIAVWAWDFDYKVKAYKRNTSKTFPTEIYNKSTGKVHNDFRGGTFPLSVVCGIVQCPNFNYKTLFKGKYPAAYSRGLQSNGRWLDSSSNNEGGVFGSKGGLVAYYDGSVEWYSDTVNKFTRYPDQTKTSKICDAIPNIHRSMGGASNTDSNFLSWINGNACDI